jgi:hypothetical protein
MTINPQMAGKHVKRMVKKYKSPIETVAKCQPNTCDFFDLRLNSKTWS